MDSYNVAPNTPQHDLPSFSCMLTVKSFFVQNVALITFLYPKINTVQKRKIQAGEESLLVGHPQENLTRSTVCLCKPWKS